MAKSGRRRRRRRRRQARRGRRRWRWRRQRRIARRRRGRGWRRSWRRRTRRWRRRRRRRRWGGRRRRSRWSSSAPRVEVPDPSLCPSRRVCHGWRRDWRDERAERERKRHLDVGRPRSWLTPNRNSFRARNPDGGAFILTHHKVHTLMADMRRTICWLLTPPHPPFLFLSFPATCILRSCIAGRGHGGGAPPPDLPAQSLFTPCLTGYGDVG